MRAIWKGSISFDLVNILIALYPATKKEELHFQREGGRSRHSFLRH
jgi:non-homologous end joining protein Ku